MTVESTMHLADLTSTRPAVPRMDAPGSSEMSAMVLREFGPPDVLTLESVPRPDPGPGEVRVRVAAVTVNTSRDVQTRSGRGSFSRLLTLPHILGCEHAGRVDAVGQGVEQTLVGRRVAVKSAYTCGRCGWCAAGEEQACAHHELLGIHRPGAYAEYTIARRSSLFDVPDDMSFVDASALLVTGPVAATQLRVAGVEDGDVVVVPGVNGAMGVMVAALATRRGARVVGLTRHPAVTASLPVDVDVVVDAAADDLQSRVRKACGPDGATAVIDNICAAPAWGACLAALAPKGRVVVSGTFGSGQAEIDTRRLYLNNQSLLGVRSCTGADEQAFWAQVNAGFRLPHDLTRTFPLAEAADVHRQIETTPKVGNYVLVVDDRAR